mgnify:CR=1 FL=1
MSADAKDLGAGSINSTTGKPVFINAGESYYNATERTDISNQDRMNYRISKLQRSLEAIVRRDAVYHDLAQENYTGGNITMQVLGTPYPVIEPFPHIMECYKSVRWYEHAAGVAGAVLWRLNARSNAITRWVKNPRTTRFYFPMMIYGITATVGAVRAQDRLMGLAENEYECDKYGVYDSPENLERKAKNWAKYSAYKAEWMRRYNYNSYGERPEESGTWMSSCMLRYKSIGYNTRTNYPTRKNPIWLSEAPLRDLHAEFALTYALPPKNLDAAEKRSADPVQAGRPELSHRYQGPLANAQ